MVDSEYSTGHYKPSNVSIKRKKKKNRNAKIRF